MAELGVNLDHVATVRQARRTAEPDPVWAAVEAQLGGADALTVHLREDRRHVQDHDVGRLASVTRVKLNLEMAPTDEMTAIAARVGPRMATLVPEGRAEITTEGGLGVAEEAERLADVVARLHDAGIRASAFIDAEPRQVEAAAAAGFDVCEIHTGPYAHAADRAGEVAAGSEAERELEKVAAAGRRIREAGMQFNAGHALNERNAAAVAALPGVRELHIGHALVARAIFLGLREAVREMKTRIAG